MLPVIFKLGPFTVHSYGLMVALAFLAGIGVSLFMAQKERIARQAILDLSVFVIISSIVGARLFYVIGQPGYFLTYPLEIIMVQNGGLVFLGGLFLSILTIDLFAAKQGLPVLKLLDCITPGAALGYVLGRIGCFLNGCCFGLPTGLPWGVIFPQGSLAGAYCPGEYVHPTQLYSALTMLAVFALLIFIYRKKSWDGQIFFTGLALYALYRFFIEFVRYSPIHWLNLTPSQWLSLASAAFCIWGFRRFATR